VAEAVVDFLEAVQVDEEQAELAVVERVCDELVHEPPVGQARESVVQGPERYLPLAAAACSRIADGTLERAGAELVTAEAAVRAMLERRSCDGVRGVIDDHDDRDLGRTGAQARERRERGLGIGPGREHDTLMSAAAGELDGCRNGRDGVDAQARIVQHRLEIEQREGGDLIGDDECPQGAANGLSRGFLAVRSR
jgi:hypothetical protein